ncbi:hypothetical protein EGI26_12450 [Lacihabitans sp. CCS-44]|uniref:hypothetical protein n=1 Tax=Lacihabitans sp. CCS-44 TaxID=2487331 RepID=UPI0020CF29B9|nr:hypothetical protein [Lacihabitans sp. CCS-44]MCP9755965.1 hypothetical protein [Lacihabitans sp. CCS-44]
MKNNMGESSLKAAKKLGVGGILLCGVCCTFPFIGAFFGISSLGLIAMYLEKAGVLAVSVAALFLVYYFYKKKQNSKSCATVCDVNCDCKGKES